MVEHKGLDKCDIYMCCNVDDPNLLILSKDRVCFARIKSKEDKRIKSVDLGGELTADCLLSNWTRVLDTWTEKTVVNRKVLIQMLEAMDSENVGIKLCTDSPLILHGVRKGQHMVGAIGNIETQEMEE